MLSFKHKKAAAALTAACILLTGCLSASAMPPAKQSAGSSVRQVYTQKQKPKILTHYKRVKYKVMPPETDLGKYKGKASAIMNKGAKSILLALGVNPKHISGARIIRDNDTDKIVYRTKIDGTQVDFDKKGNISSYTNNKSDTKSGKNVKNKINSKKDFYNAIKKLSKVIDFHGYKESYFSNMAGYFSASWNKDIGNGVLNPYDVICVCVRATDGCIWLYGRNTITPNATVPIVTKDQAIEFAQPVIKKFSGAKCSGVSLTVFKPDFYWEAGGPYKSANFARLAYKVSIDEKGKNMIDVGAEVMIDAQTGEILGGDVLK